MGMFIITFGLIVLLLGVLQTTIVKSIAIAGIKPDLFLIIAVFLAFKLGRPKREIAGFSIGLLEDFFLLSTRIIGINAFCKGFVCFLVGITRETFFLGAFTFQIVTLFFVTIIKSVMTSLFGVFILNQSFNLGLLWKIPILESLYTALLFVPITLLLERVYFIVKRR
jgi:rod shape-determining protein MreD